MSMLAYDISDIPRLPFGFTNLNVITEKRVDQVEN